MVTDNIFTCAFDYSRQLEGNKPNHVPGRNACSNTPFRKMHGYIYIYANRNQTLVKTALVLKPHSRLGEIFVSFYGAPPTFFL